ncbi:MAG TPA: alpha-amylase [Bacteroidales bacterium]|nr:MAG: alpha-amylase [Bacteroidetes bacterium GWF2_33_38]OFY72167.1 MAG: alpha-amylase [Bacteroidetes bacterium RIFOXYA12_FULL_33_9]OFY86002.1 MAG: alpha-amylase [Bacteroidetes bacterium RIFOXYA2_FULL_33_7]HBF88933.1 alpha-amylase [Bacteroidales bacterium]
MKIIKLGIVLFVIVAIFGACNNSQTVQNEQQSDSTQLVHPKWSYNATIYEVNVRQFTEAGTFKAFEEHLPRLKAMGVDIIWIMPIHPIGEKERKGSLGSYYSVKDYKGVNPEFGTMEDFKQLVNKIHELGMYVILDWVANHTAWDNAWVSEHPEWYTKDSLGKMVSPFDWTDVADLNYDEKGLHEAMIDALKFWITDANIDGYRCDVAELVPVEFWNEARTELDKIKPVFMLAEADKADLQTKAFDMTYGWEFHFIMNDVAQGKKKIKDINEYFEREKTKYKADDFRMQFTSNHDENSWKGTEFTRLGGGYKTFAVMAATIPGMPLIYNGQEAEMDKMLRFFEKDTIFWDKKPLEQFYTKLMTLKHNNKALWNGERGGEMKLISNSADSVVYSFARVKDENSVLVFLNLSATPTKVSFKTNDFKGEYTDLFTDAKTNILDQLEISLTPWEYKVLSK